MTYSAYTFRQGDNIQPWCTPFPIWSQSVVPCPVLTVASWPAYKVSQETSQMVWYSHLFKNFPQFIVIHTVKGFGIVNKAEIDVFFRNSLTFLMIQQMLAIWSLVLLPFLKPAKLTVRGMQIKTKVGYYVTAVRMAIIKKTRNNNCWQGYGEKETFISD